MSRTAADRIGRNSGSRLSTETDIVADEAWLDSTASADESGLRSRVLSYSRAHNRCADLIVEVMVRVGVDTVYGVPGGAISPLYDALVDCPFIRVIHTRHETTALFMAIGHTRMRPGSLPCVLLTSGPGVTNAVTGLAAALGEGVPVLVIGGEVPRVKFGRAALQEGSTEGIDVVSIVRTATVSAEHVSIPGRAGYQVAAAARRAQRLRGPVFLSLPLDVAVAPAAPTHVAPVEFLPTPPPAAVLDEAAKLLSGAERPLVLLGSGARTASSSIRAFVERLNIPVITSPKAKGVVSEEAPYCLGVFGYGGHPSALSWLQEAPPDVVLALGCGLNEPSTNSWSSLLQGSKAMIQVDLDPGQFGRNYRTDLAIEADCAVVVPALDQRIQREPWPVSLPGLRPISIEASESELDPAQVLAVVQEELPPDTIYTSDIGEHLLFAIHCLRARYPEQFIASLALGSMGSGIGAAIGAKCAAPERTVVSVSGDFGFQMYGMDLATCVQEKLGVIFVIMNDARMRMVEAGIDRIYGRGLPMDGPPIDFAAVALAHGADGAVVTSVDELRRALRNRNPERPLVVDARIPPNTAFPVNARVQEISNFTAK